MKGIIISFVIVITAPIWLLNLICENELVNIICETKLMGTVILILAIIANLLFSYLNMSNKEWYSRLNPVRNIMFFKNYKTILHNIYLVPTWTILLYQLLPKDASLLFYFYFLCFAISLFSMCKIQWGKVESK